MAQCVAVTKTGARCRNNAIPGTKYCYVGSHGYQHKPFVARLKNWFANHWLGAAELGVGTLALLLILIWRYQDQVQQALSGIIEPLTSEYPKYLAVGGVLFDMHTENGVLLEDGDEPLVSMRIAGGRMLVSAKMKNDQDDLVAELKDNEWTHQPRPAIFDRNYNKNILEIKDVAGRVALQVVDLGESVQIAGVFHCSKDHSTYAIGPAADGGAVIDISPPGMRAKYEIPAVCEYPSDQHFGSCPGSTRIAALVKNRVAYPIRTILQVCKADAANHRR